MMNKQEAIERIESRAFNIGDIDLACGLSYTKNIINQIDEPQKVVVPKFVAEWYEIYKNDLENAIYNTIIGTYRKLDGVNNVSLGTFEGWFVCEDNSILTLVQIHLFGYEVEKEKLYTVEIPDPNSTFLYRFLSRNGNGVCIDASNHIGWESRRKNHLTEAEIKQDFEWAFQFAKPVEEN